MDASSPNRYGLLRSLEVATEKAYADVPLGKPAWLGHLSCPAPSVPCNMRLDSYNQIFTAYKAALCKDRSRQPVLILNSRLPRLTSPSPLPTMSHTPPLAPRALLTQCNNPLPPPPLTAPPILQYKHKHVKPSQSHFVSQAWALAIWQNSGLVSASWEDTREQQASPLSQPGVIDVL
ncbi:hypothetical protein ElyMa_004291800 [Elysia marginata]|uniref:Uncharacterized protein n=1 Tax=Elysia marginata TaxID=1093978 RepID=A0AAV4GWM7_9GAST|nr:hypothetical protein ElyMa_004291800 [Elysia marginata]